MTIRAVLLLTPLLFAAMIQPSSVWGQKTGKVYRLGWVWMAPAPPEGVPNPAVEALKGRLAERGYIEGKNLVIELRWADTDYQQVPRLTADLVRSGADVIFTGGTKTARIVQEAVKSTPLVVYSCDPWSMSRG